MIIAHDLGTTGNKASLHDDEGHTLAACTVEYPTHYAAGGVAEQDPEDWWSAVGEATRLLLERSGVEAARISGIGLSGQMMGAVFLDGEGRPARPAMIWADHRSKSQADRLVGAVGMEAAYGELGHRINPTYTLAKVMWVRDHEPETWARTRHVCLAKDFVTLRLTGLLVTDPSDASGTNAYDQRGGTWSERLLGAAEIDSELWPEIVPSTTVAGGLTPDAARHLGLMAGTPVVVGGGDGPMAAVGAGVVDASDGAYASLGSSSWVSVTAEKPLHDPAMRSMTFDHVIPGLFVPTATMQAGAASLQWAVEVFGRSGTAQDYSDLLQSAATVRAAEEGLYFLPHLMGERSPYWNPSATGAFAGLGRHHSREHLVRAVLEGVAFNLRTCLTAFAEGGVPISRVDAIGGGARSEVWLQIMADIWGVPVCSRSIVEDANSLGAAVTALVGLGIQPDFAVARTLSQITGELQPDPTHRSQYARLHEDFLSAYTHLEPWFARDNGDRP